MKSDFTKLTRLQEKALGAKLAAVRKAATHAGEKGRFLEESVRRLLRDLLPAEYGVSTGFIAYHSGAEVKLSPQLDIILYDALRSAPLAKLEVFDVFPLEAVYGYVEVKAALKSSPDSAKQYAMNSIERFIETNRLMRGMLDRRYYIPKGSHVIVKPDNSREISWGRPLVPRRN